MHNFFWYFWYSTLIKTLEHVYFIGLGSWQKPISVHVSFSFYFHLSSKFWNISSQIVQKHFCFISYLNLHWFSSALHPGGHIDRISKEAISGHLGSHHPSSGCSRVDSNPDLQPQTWIMRNQDSRSYEHQPLSTLKRHSSKRKAMFGPLPIWFWSHGCQLWPTPKESLKISIMFVLCKLWRNDQK